MTKAERIDSVRRWWSGGKPHYLFHRKASIGRFEAELSWRSKKNLMGRFGGGWNWKIGIQAGGRAVIFSLLILEIRFCFYKARKEQFISGGG